MSNRIDSSLTCSSVSQLKQVQLLEKENADAERVHELQRHMQELEMNRERMFQHQTLAFSTNQSSSESRAALTRHIIKLDAENRELRKLLCERNLGQGLKQLISLLALLQIGTHDIGMQCSLLKHTNLWMWSCAYYIKSFLITGDYFQSSINCSMLLGLLQATHCFSNHCI